MLINLNLYFKLQLLLLFIFKVNANQNGNLNYHLLNTHLNTPSKFYKSFFDTNQYDFTVNQPNKRDLTNKLNDELLNSVKYEYDLSNTYQKLPEEENQEYPKYEYKLNDLDILTNKQEIKKPIKNEIELNSLNDEKENKEKIENNLEYSIPINYLDDYLRIASEDDYSYDEQDKWSGTCTSEKPLQSPIALDYRNSRLDFRAKVDLGVRYSKNIDVTIVNTGHTVQFEIPKSAGNIIITGPAFDYEIYKAAAVHWHWGENNTVGSEHVLNGYRYPLEMHIVHYNTKYFSLDDALKHRDGTVVVGILFQIGRKNEDIESIIQNLNNIRCKKQKANVNGVNLLRLFPSKVKRLYQYYGSLTTPPCTPTINWIVIETPNFISSEQIAKFRQLTMDELCQNENLRNWRDLQDIKNRDIKRSIKL